MIVVTSVGTIIFVVSCVYVAVSLSPMNVENLSIEDVGTGTLGRIVSTEHTWSMLRTKGSRGEFTYL